MVVGEGLLEGILASLRDHLKTEEKANSVPSMCGEMVLIITVFFESSSRCVAQYSLELISMLLQFPSAGIICVQHHT